MFSRITDSVSYTDYTTIFCRITGSVLYTWIVILSFSCDPHQSIICEL